MNPIPTETHRSITAKSLLIGLLSGVLLTVVTGATTPKLGERNGRYQLDAVGNKGLVIDTATGQVWVNHFNPNNGKSTPEFFNIKLPTSRND